MNLDRDHQGAEKEAIVEVGVCQAQDLNLAPGLILIQQQTNRNLKTL